MKKNGKLVLVLYAFDIGPSKNLQKIENVALVNGNGTRSAYNCKLDGTNLISPETDALITGLSSFKSFEELEMGKIANMLNIPWFIIADTHENWGRPNARDKIKNAIVIVASPDEIQGALNFGYRDAVYLGGPPEWNDFWSIKPAEIDLGKKLSILVGGIKLPEINHTLLREAVKAMNTIGLDYQLIYKPHPNENNNTTGESVEEILEDVDVIETDARLMNLLPVVDLTILTSGTTAIIQAAHQRTPTIYFENDMIIKRMREQIGTSKWIPIEAGVSLKADSSNIVEKIQELLTREGVKNLQEQQKKIYPKPETINKKSEKRILDYIKSQL